MRGAFAVALALVIGCSSNSKPIPPAPTDDAEAIAFLQLVRDGKSDAAWATTGSEFKSYMGKAEFAKYVKQHPALKQPVGVGTKSSDGDGAMPLVKWAYLTKQDKPATIVVTIGVDDGNWKVVGIDVSISK